MRYMMIMCHDLEDGPSPAQIAASPDFARWDRQTQERGVTHRGFRLRPAQEAVTVRVRGGEVIVSDGPFVETKEQIGGFEVVECSDLDEAIEVASGHPSSRFSVEIRPFWGAEA